MNRYINTRANRIINISLATFLLLLCCLQQLFAANAEVIPWPADKQLDNFTLPDLQGNSSSLSDYNGKVVLVNFWASWCAPCVYEMPELKRLKELYKGKSFEIIAINVGENKYKVRKFTKLTNFDLPVLLDPDSETFSSWEVNILPTSFLIDARGQIRYRFRGNPGWDTNDTRSMIDKLIAESASTVK